MNPATAAAALIAACLATAAAAQGIGPRPGDGPILSGFGPGRIGAALSEMDSDGDGAVTRAEADGFAAARFAAADTDGDGALSPDEIVAHLEAQRLARLAARVAAGVATADDSGDGLLQFDEIAARLQPVAPLFDRLDSDSSGALEAAELSAAEERMAARRAERHEEGRPLGGWFGHGPRHGG